MNELMSYIFGTLQKNEATLSQVVKILNRQSRANAWLVLVGAGYLCVSECRRKEQEKKIKELREELDKLMGKNVDEETEAGE